MSRRVSVPKSNVPSDIEIKLLYGFFSPEAVHEFTRVDEQTWRHAESSERQLEIIRAFRIMDGTTESKKEQYLVSPNQMTLNTAARAAASMNDWETARALYKKGAAMSAVLFGTALAANFTKVDEILEKYRQKMREGVSPEKCHFAALLNAAATGAALARADDAAMRYRREGANAFYIAWAYGMVNDVTAINALCQDMKPYRDDLIKAALTGFGIGGHFESAFHASQEFTENIDALILGVAMRNEELHKRFLSEELASPQYAFLGYVLAGHLTKADDILQAQKIVNPQFDNARFLVIMFCAALQSQRYGYAKNLFSVCESRNVSLRKSNEIDKTDFLRSLVCTGEIAPTVRKRSARKSHHPALFQDARDVEQAAPDTVNESELPLISARKKVAFSMV